MQNQLAALKFLYAKVQEFNKDWGYDLDVKIQFWNKDFAEYQGYTGGHGVIRLDPYQKRSEILEDLYHELGHAVLDQYKVPRYMLNIFRDHNPNISREKSEKLTCDDEIPPPPGYVSWYSMVNGTEEFCELLSAWACSGYPKKGYMNYGGWKHSIDSEPKLKRKIKVIKEIISIE
jgi:hypothetical protein